ncbi:serine hydrolase [Streptomyces sp. A7024]|uniref:Serine hydrolase n=1 Tax=Streptomyces coryli TaxID=1128680 RepID=A0A6G4TXZ8_9ACTN|nr:serine hydrolase [Streptomyces coryli]NGN64693.1 serine hydrolase [Streptomyces coryli]
MRVTHAAAPRFLPTVTLAALLACALPGQAAAAPTPRAAAVTCASEDHPGIARQLERGLRTALQGRPGTAAFAVHDARRGLDCSYHAGRRIETASVAKLMIMQAVAYRAKLEHRTLSPSEKQQLRPMITASDNNAASRLWSHVGRERMQRFVEKAGLGDTELGWGRYWGLSQTTARDQLILLDHLTRKDSPLATPASRAYMRDLLAHIRTGQRWGVTAGAPAGARVRLKNGWLPRPSGGWRVHSVGTVGGGDRDYRIAVLTTGSASMDTGVRTVERVARAVHAELGDPAPQSREGRVLTDQD